MAPQSSNSFRQYMIVIAVLLVVGLPFVYAAIIVPLSPAEQAQVSLALIAFGMLATLSHVMRPIIIFLSCFASMRYFYWRISSTVNLDNGMDATVSIFLLAAEIYGLLILFLGYAQTIEASSQTSPPLHKFPSVDVFIPTYNEPVDIVRRTAIGALSIDYPAKKIYILDDGRRPQIEAVAQTLGCIYLTRPDNVHAKAGNLNHALARTSGDFIAIFDADHVPVRCFLQRTMGFFEDVSVALVQTAQHFFNPDPFERNLNLAGKIAPEQHFFYHVIQPGNDFWNSAFFCGSSAVLRRSALEKIGGFKTSTVTEDAHTSLELHAHGYRSVYLPIALAAGLATETFAAHVKQRTRWARGMAQILRTDCPLFKRGLSLPQRLNYFNAMLHFFFGLPRLIMILAPLTYLLFGAHPIKADVLAVIAYILPHIGLSTIANSIISKNFRHSFWAGVYEISIAPYTALATLTAMINPAAGAFNVTDKGTNLDQARYDVRTSAITLLLVGLTLSALMIGFPLRLVAFSVYSSDPSELDSILINSLWALANLIILIAAACVGIEQPQQRRTPRIKRNFKCQIIAGEERIDCHSIDLSESGARVVLDDADAVPAYCFMRIQALSGESIRLAVKRVWCDWNASGKAQAAFSFVEVDAAVHEVLVRILFTGDQSWTEQVYVKDRVTHSLWYLATTLWRATRARRKSTRQAPEVRGQWQAWYGDIECECVSISAVGSVIRISRQTDITPGQRARFRLELDPFIFVEAEASLKASTPESDSWLAEFHWADFSSMRTFSSAIYEHTSGRRTDRGKPFWNNWAEDLR